MAYLTEKQLNIIRGKALVGHASIKEIFSVFEHLDSLEEKLEEYSYGDFWRHAFGLTDAD